MTADVDLTVFFTLDSLYSYHGNATRSRKPKVGLLAECKSTKSTCALQSDLLVVL